MAEEISGFSQLVQGILDSGEGEGAGGPGQSLAQAAGMSSMLGGRFREKILHFANILI
jgi:hypothetical protein